jgi:hypothetical protein
MLVSFRQRITQWFRLADFKPGGLHYPVETEENQYIEPMKATKYSNGIASMSVKLQKKSSSGLVGASENSIISDGISFQVFPGAGGVAIQVQSYDRNRDERSTKLHIIPEDKDMAEALAHILSIEAMRR